MASKKKKSLADQILELSNPAPKDWDPENVGLTSTWKPVEDEVDFDDSQQQPRSVGKSLRGISLTEGKYAGKPASRKEVFDEEEPEEDANGEDAQEEEDDDEQNGFDDEEDQEDEDEEDEDNNNTVVTKPKQAAPATKLKKTASSKIDSLFKGLEFDSENEEELDFGAMDEELDDDEEAEEQDEDEEADDFDEQDDGVDIVQKKKETNPYAVSSSAMDEAEKMMKELEEEQQATIVVRKVSDTDELSKAHDTKNQKVLLDSFMDTRIRIQRGLQIANRFPQHDDYPHFVKDEDVKSRYDEAYQSVEDLLFNLVQLRDDLIKANPAVEKAVAAIPASKKRKVPDSPTGHSVEDWWEVVSAYDESFEPYMEDTINKWNQRVQLASGQHAGKQFKVLNQSVMTQVKNILADKERNRKKAQLKRSQFSVIGKPETQNQNEDKNDKKPQQNAHLNDYDEEIYDDTDFYQSLLKEIIEGSGQDVDARYILETHRLRRKQKNKKHDSGNNKDRRIKYVTHDKLIGFMAPQLNIQKQKARQTDSTALRLWSNDDFNLALFGQSVKVQ